MGREEQIIQERIKKLEELRKQGINPYPNKFDKKNTIEDCIKSKLKTKVKTAGRLMTKRDLGKIIFASLQDQSGKIQLNDNIIQVEDIQDIMYKKRVELPNVIVSLRIDKGSDMGIVNDIQQALRKADSRRINYSAMLKL